MAILTVDFVGLGLMGPPMVQNLLKSGHAVGGVEEDVEAARPLLDCMGSDIVHCGPVGTAANNASQGRSSGRR